MTTRTPPQDYRHGQHVTVRATPGVWSIHCLAEPVRQQGKLYPRYWLNPVDDAAKGVAALLPYGTLCSPQTNIRRVGQPEQRTLDHGCEDR